MKFSRLIILGILIFLSSCRGDESDLVKIDQVLNIYIKNSAGKRFAQYQYSWRFYRCESSGFKCGQSFARYYRNFCQKDQDTIAYVDYATGVVRILKDSIS